MSMYLFFILLSLGILCPCDTIIPGSRLLDFPNPDFSTVITLPDKDGKTFLEVKHNFGNIPFHVRVYATSSEGNNINFVFEGTGACQNEGKARSGPYGGLIYGYNEESITIWAPRAARFRSRAGSMIYVGEGWGSNKYSQNSKLAKVTVEAWRSGPLPTYETKIPIDTKVKSTFKLLHPLQQLPEMISVRVSDANGRLSGMHFHAVSASQTSSRAKTVGGVIFAYSITELMFWTPTRPKTGCIYIGKNWGKGKTVSSRNCFIDIRLWVNAFPPPVFQSDWMTVNSNDHAHSFIEIQHKLRLLPTYVRVQYRSKDVVDPLVFEGSGSVQTAQSGKNRFGGVLFAYDKFAVRLWLPSSSKKNKAYIIFVGDGWGDSTHSMYNETAELRVQVFADKCRDKTQVVDAQGYCRDISEVELIPKPGPWGKCSNPCGNGTKKREVQGCTGLSLQTVFNCNFSTGNCGFHLSAVDHQSTFNWSRSADIQAQEKERCKETPADLKQMSKNNKFLKDVMLKEPHFIYSVTKPCVGGERVNPHEGILETGDLENAQGCILTFRYTAESYFNRFQIDVLPTNEKEWQEGIDQDNEMWLLEDGKVQRGVWRSGYVNIGNYVRHIKRFRFVHKLPYSLRKVNHKCPGRCHSVLLTNITLRCEKDDQHLVSEEKCEEKKLPLSSCIVNAFHPFSKGPAWSVHNHVKNIEDIDIGSFVTAGGKRGDLIATYVFNIKMKDTYHIWFESFSLTNATNDITVEINDKEKFSENLIYNEERAIWLPMTYLLQFHAGKHQIKLYQREKFFKYRNLMISPRNISVWSALGMQSQLIPDNNFKTLSMTTSLLGYSRLNGKGGWAPTDNSRGMMYFEIQFPEIALVNKIATQGGKSLGRGPHSYTCMMESFKLKFSLHKDIVHESFAFYREKIKDRNPYEFAANTDINGIVMHTFKFALVARAVRIYPQNYTWPTCLRVELYGFYMIKGMCPDLSTKTREKNCTGNGVCEGGNRKCWKDTFTQNSKCDCNNGYHGESCNMTGCDQNPCWKGTCVNNGDNFKCDCQPGFYGRYCHLGCPKGRYGRDCVHLCTCSEKEYCDPRSGQCSCFPGYEGLKCDERCSNMTYGQNCSNTCSCSPPLHCDHVTGVCYCPEGYHGDTCDIECSNGTYGRNCTKGCNCLNNGTCTADGKCDCLPGWFSNTCQFPCPEGRFGKMCSQLCHRQGNSTCNRMTGELTCAKGFTGRFCNKRCRDGQYGENCVHHCQCKMENTRNCRKDTGECICKAGWRGESCNEKCKGTWGEKCKHKCRCQNGGKCGHNNGLCTCLKGHNGTYCENECFEGNYGSGCSEDKGCVQGYYGLNCSSRCNCNLDTTDKCNPAIGTCRCAPGHEGDRCTVPCDRDHWGMNCEKDCLCQNEATCDSRDGSCYCAKGFDGEMCERKCDQGKYGRNCKETCKCKNGADCERTDGKCICQPGYIGEYCEQQCNDGWYGNHCTSSCQCDKSRTVKCNHVNGSCTCMSGFKGERCEQECDDGFYGHRCQQSCPQCRHSYHACNKTNGTCSCIDGFKGEDCMDDCEMSKYGPLCTKSCTCDPDLELCHNINGTCYMKNDYIFKVNLHYNRYTLKYFLKEQENLKENTALLIWNCLKGNNIDSYCMGNNSSNYSHIPGVREENKEEHVRRIKLVNTFFVRIVEIESRFSSNNEEVSVVTMTLLNNTKPVNGSIIEDLLFNIPKDVLSRALDYEYYKGETYVTKRPLDQIMSKMKWIVIGLSSFGGLLTVFLICLICRCTTRVPYPPPFQKVRRDSKDFEMQPNMTCNSHLLAFENPYYDVIAAMGLDDDIEEDYYNPLYDNMMELHSDSETEPEDMYYFFRNNNYHREVHNYACYDKDSGFSSGPLM